MRPWAMAQAASVLNHFDNRFAVVIVPVLGGWSEERRQRRRRVTHTPLPRVCSAAAQHPRTARDGHVKKQSRHVAAASHPVYSHTQ